MGQRRLTTRVLAGCGIAAGALLLLAPAAAAGVHGKQVAAAATAAATPGPAAQAVLTTAPPTTAPPATAPPSAAPPATTAARATTAAPTSTPPTTPPRRAAAASSHPPAQPVITSSPTSPGTAMSATWTFSDPNGGSATITCSLSYGGSAVFGPAACAGTETYDLTGRPYGTYTFAVTATQNSLTSTATSTYTLVPVAPTFTAEPTTPGSDTTPTWTFTLPAGTTGRCTLTRSGVTVAGPADCTGTSTPTLTTNGTYTLSVAAVGNGQTSAAVTSTYTLDTIAPTVPVITGGPAVVSMDDTPAWTFTTSADTAATLCTITSGSTVVVASAPCASGDVFDLTLQPDAPYTFSVVARDAVGNTSAPATSTYTLQHIPAAPTPTIQQAPASPDNDATPTWTFTTAAGTTTQCTLLLGSTVVAGPVACSGSQTFTVATDGTYTFRVVAFDTVTGAQSLPATSTYTYDGTPPGVPVFTSQPASPGTNDKPVWRFTTPAGATSLQCTLRRGTTIVHGPVNCSGSYTRSLKNLPDGQYTLTVVAFDAVGNFSSASSSYTIDRVAPAVPVISGGPTGLTNDATPTWTISPVAGATLRCTVLDDNDDAVVGPSTCTSPYTANLLGLPDGTYTFSVVSTDALGNESAPDTATIELDTTAPQTPTVTSGPSATDATPTWTFRARGDVETVCSVSRGATVVVAAVPCSSPAGFDLTRLGAGTYTFSVVSIDDAGNRSAPGTSTYTLRAAAPAPAPTPLPPAPPAGPPAPAPTPPALSPTPDPRPAARPRPGPAPAPGPAPGPPAVLGPLSVPTTVPPPAGIVAAAGRVATEAAEGAAFPLILLALVILFLAIQDRIDRRDPKLAHAPVHASDDLVFGPPPSRRGSS